MRAETKPQATQLIGDMLGPGPENGDESGPKGIIFSANGSSMFPAIVKGDRIHIEGCAQKPLYVGEIVLCRGVSGRFYVHRLMEISPSIRTRGDALTQADEEIAEVLARVVRIEPTLRSRLRRWTIRIRRIFHARG